MTHPDFSILSEHGGGWAPFQLLVQQDHQAFIVWWVFPMFPGCSVSWIITAGTWS